MKTRLRNKILLACMSAWFFKLVKEYKDYAEIASTPNIHDNHSECLNKSNITIKIDKRKSLKNPKYILLWTPNNFAPFNFFKQGNIAFVENGCPVTNCYVTNNGKYFGSDLTKFDAIAFNGRNLKSNNIEYLRRVRSPHQKYIYFNKESPEYHPCCNHIFDGFFNWTVTFKLNSDIVFPYLLIRNRAGEEVGPKVNMIWNVSNSNGIVRLNKKMAAVVWIASDCVTRSKRENYVSALQKALKFHKLKLDIYGACGTRVCTRNASCDRILKKYYFYLSFENSITEDYVTEKVFTALKNNIVPVVYGGADYSRYSTLLQRPGSRELQPSSYIRPCELRPDSYEAGNPFFTARFLPPKSFLDASKQSPKKLALKIHRFINDPRAYSGFFNWRNSYSFSYSEAKDVCRVCAALNNQTLFETKTVYQEFRSWWNPDYVRRCKEMMNF